jgi:drug/metabolite transporter (DMT)-like permease
MAEVLALVAALLFALAATLQQKGALDLPELSLRHPESVIRLAGQTTWLMGTVALLCGYAFQAAALDRGRLVIIQPLLVTTILFALPLGYLLTHQHVGRREVLGAAAIVLGLTVFAIAGDPAGGRENAPGVEWAVAIVVVAVLCAALLLSAGHGNASRRAAVYGAAAGLLFGLSASLTKPAVEYLHDGIGAVLSHWELYALLIAGAAGFVLQQVSLGTGRLAPAVATVSVVNPVVCIVLGSLLLDERFSRPAWHVVVALGGLAVLISFAREAGGHERPAAAPAGPAIV